MLHECTLGKTIVLWEAAVLYIRMTSPFGGGDAKDKRRPTTVHGKTEMDVAQRIHAIGGGMVHDVMPVRSLDGLDPVQRMVIEDLLASERRGHN